MKDIPNPEMLRALFTRETIELSVHQPEIVPDICRALERIDTLEPEDLERSRIVIVELYNARTAMLESQIGARKIIKSLLES